MDESDSVLEWANYNKNTYWVNGVPWKLEGSMLSPIQFPHTEIRVDKVALKQAIDESGAMLARWYTNWNSSTETKWWWICCNEKNYSVENIRSSRGRRGVRKGLKNVEVHQIPSDQFGSLSYLIYRNAQISYGVAEDQIMSEKTYIEECASKGKFNGCEYWGSFVDDQLIAYSTCLVLNNAVSLGATKSNPDFHKLNPNNVLFFKICEHYLNNEQRLYVTNGVRTLLHPTTINDFLMNMNFEKVYCDLNVLLSTKAKLIHQSKVPTWGKYVVKPIAPSKWKLIEGFGKLMDCAT